MATVAATVLSIGTAYIVLQFNSLMDYVQLLFSFFNAPVFATFLLGMFTKWATPWGAFWGLLAGTLGSVLHRLCYSAHVLTYASDMTANFYGAVAAWVICFAVTTAVSMVTKRRDATELKGLVYEGGGSSIVRSRAGTWMLAILVGLGCLYLNWQFR